MRQAAAVRRARSRLGPEFSGRGVSRAAGRGAPGPIGPGQPPLLRESCPHDVPIPERRDDRGWSGDCTRRQSRGEGTRHARRSRFRTAPILHAEQCYRHLPHTGFTHPALFICTLFSVSLSLLYRIQVLCYALALKCN